MYNVYIKKKKKTTGNGRIHVNKQFAESRPSILFAFLFLFPFFFFYEIRKDAGTSACRSLYTIIERYLRFTFNKVNKIINEIIVIIELNSGDRCEWRLRFVGFIENAECELSMFQ